MKNPTMIAIKSQAKPHLARLTLCQYDEYTWPQWMHENAFRLISLPHDLQAKVPGMRSACSRQPTPTQQLAKFKHETGNRSCTKVKLRPIPAAVVGGYGPHKSPFLWGKHYVNHVLDFFRRLGFAAGSTRLAYGWARHGPFPRTALDALYD
jgi:hypothetical protein